MESLVMAELHDWDKGGPGFGIVRTEDPHVNLKLLVDAFSFSVSLRMVDSASKGLETKNTCDLFENL